MSKEVKIGLLALTAIAVSIWGFRFIKGSNLLRSSNTFYAQYADVDMLQASDPVLINGYQVGVVTDVYLKPDRPDIIEVAFEVKGEIALPETTLAEIVSTGFMGGKAIVLTYQRPCTGDDCAESGAYFQSASRGLLGSMIGEPAELKEYGQVLSSSLGTVFDTISSRAGDPDSEIGRSLQDIQTILTNLKSTTASLNQLVRASTTQMDAVLANMEPITGNVEASNRQVTRILSNADTFSSQLTRLELQRTLNEASDALKQLSTTLNTTNDAMEDINEITAKINSDEGTIGKLLNDNALYYRLTQASMALDTLATDLQERPYRYVPLKSRKRVLKHDRRDAALEDQQAISN